ncbi:MAG: chemotaxis protein CheB [Alphaproteobacteria bacterium]
MAKSPNPKTRTSKKNPKRTGVRAKAPAKPEAAGPDAACPVVALGASAGGLEALTRFLEAMPPDSGMAFVLIQHLDPEHQSMMAELLGTHTAMTVAAARDGMAVEPGHVYVIPPKAVLTIRDRKLRLEPQRERALGRMPIDAFFRSLAEDQREKAIGIILTGTGTDGTLGLKAVKEKGGLVIVQDPDEAPHAGMPRSAIATGMADLVLPVAEMPDTLLAYVRHRYFRADAAPSDAGEKDSDTLPALLNFLKNHSPVNFDLYKEGTLLRRIERRMGLNHIQSGRKYLEFLRKNPREVEELRKDLLISVTSFFRDPEVFDYLESDIIPGIVKRHGADEPIRAWVAGCASGEEAYSLAMLLAEQVAAAGRRRRIQIFASDVDEQALAIARAGVYPESIETEVSRERLARFFVKDGHSYRVLPELREMIVFANHDLLSDAPFSKLDLVLCRNLLIYINPEVQKRIITLFHFALRRDGILVLGLSETTGDQTDLFQPVSGKLRVYRRTAHTRRRHFDLPVARARRTAPPAAPEAKAPHRSLALAELTRRILIERFSPAAVLINAKNEGLYFSGPVDAFLRVPAGEASRDFIAMLRNGLQVKVRRAVAEAGKSRQPAVIRDAFVVRGGVRRPVTVRVDPVDHEGANLLLVTFTEEQKEEAESPGEAQAGPADVQDYERELEETRRELQSTIRDLERANEELKAANEEAMSMNEEFQSTNEELETSKEELQSLNEELTTLNNQLQEKVEEQRRTANDLENLLTSSDITTVFLDRELKIRQFTRSATALFNLVPSDTGRALTDIKWKIEDPALIKDAREVLENLVPRERDLQAEDGRWFTRRVLPYRTQTNVIEGVVITLFDITAQKVAQAEAQTARAFYESIVDTVREPLIVLDRNLKVVMANRAYSAAFGTSAGDVQERSIFEIEQRRWDIPEFRRLLNQVIPGNASVEDYKVDAEFKDLGRRTLLLNARRVRPAENAPDYLLLAMLDVTERERRREALEEHTARLSSILASLPAAVINVDDNGVIISFSPGAERLFGYSAEEVTGRNAGMLVPEQDRRDFEEYLASWKASGKEWAGAGREITGRRKDGSLAPLMLDVTETHIGDFRVFTAALRDLTEQKNTEEELRQARKMEVMGKLVGGVAHDFNNLLTIILGNLELLARRTAATDDRKQIQTALEAAKLAANLTHQMLIFARRRTLAPARVDLDTLIPETAEMIRRIIDESIRVTISVEKGTPAVYADEATLRAALLNLAVNARDAMPDGGQLTVRTATVKLKPRRDAGKTGTYPSAYARISVTDTGAGMTPDLLERVSEPFFTTKEIGKGSGLGLSMVYGFAKKSGGWIEIDSKPGKGTTVSILLPAMEEEPAAPPASARAAGDGDLPRGNERILVVEDDSRVRETTVMKLKMLGYEVLEAENGPAALDLLAKGEAFDLLFTDQVMPGGMSGSDLAREMRKQRPNLPVLFTSGYAPHKLALEPGDALLEKPYGIDMLAQKVREVLD